VTTPDETTVAELTSLQKAAVLVMNLDDFLVKDLLASLPPDEVRAVGMTAASLPALSRDTVEEVCLEFIGRLMSPSPLKLHGRTYVNRVLPRVTDPRIAQEIAREIEGMELRALREWLAEMPPTTLATILLREHPQTIAVVCALARPRTAVRVMEQFPDELQEEVLFRQARVQELPAEVLGEIEEILVRHTVPRVSDSRTNLEGLECAAEAMKRMPAEQREELLQRLSAQDPELGEQLMRSMFSFEMLATADERGIQQLLRGIDRQDLTLALKGAPPDLRQKMFDNMSQRAATFLAEDLEVLGPARLEEVEAAQRRIMARALVLESEGKLMFVGEDDGDMVL